MQAGHLTQLPSIGPFSPVGNLRQESINLEEIISRDEHGQNFKMSRMQKVQRQYQYNGHYRGGQRLQQSYDAGSRVREVYGDQFAIQNRQNSDSYTENFHNKGYEMNDDRMPDLPPPFDDNRCHSQLSKHMHHENRPCDSDTKSPKDLSISRQERSGGYSKNNSYDDQPRKIYWYTFTRVMAAFLIILDCVSDWLQYYDIENPLDILDEEVKNVTCVSKDDIATKYFYFTIFSSAWTALQLANVIYQIIKNYQQKDGPEPKNFLDGRTESFVSALFAEIPQNILLYGYENTCMKCIDSISKKKARRIFNRSIGLASNIWRTVTSVKQSNRKCCHTCKFPIPCLLLNLVCKHGEDACKPKPEFWSCVLYSTCCCKLVWCPKDGEWIKCCPGCESCCSNPCQRRSDSPYLGKFVYIPNVLYAFIYVLNMLKYICSMTEKERFVTLLHYVIETPLSYLL